MSPGQAADDPPRLPPSPPRHQHADSHLTPTHGRDDRRQGVVVSKRRTWDDQVYRDRVESKIKAASAAAAAKSSRGLAPLCPRLVPIDFESRVGKTAIISDLDPSTSGFYCKCCATLLRDSLSYLDHCNGKKHLANQGMKSTASRSDLRDVLAKLRRAKRRCQRHPPHEAATGSE